MTFPVRFYTDRENRIRADRVAASARTDAALLARRERGRFSREPAADSIDAVDAAYERSGIAFPDTCFRDRAIAAHHEGGASFALRPSAAAEYALGQVYEGSADLAEAILGMAREATYIGGPMSRRVQIQAGRVLPYLVPVNAAAERAIDETLERLELVTAKAEAA